jgi:hypothetical protein
MSAIDLVITTRLPELLQAMVNALPEVRCEVVQGSFDGTKCTLRVHTNTRFAHYRIVQQGYGDVLEVRPAA